MGTVLVLFLIALVPMPVVPAEPLYDRLARGLSPWLPGVYLILLWQGGWLDILLPASFVALQLLGLLLLWELVAMLTADPLTRALMRFRWRSRRGAGTGQDALTILRLIDMLRPAPASRGEAARAYGRLTEAAVRLNMRHPNPLSGPVTARRLTEALAALDAAAPPDRTPTMPPVPLSAIWPQPRPDFTLGGTVLEFRRTVGNLCFGHIHRITRLCIAGERALARRTDRAPRPALRWSAPDFPQHEIWRRASEAAVAAGLPQWNADPALLPLTAQRRLCAAVLLLSAAPRASLRARLLVPLDTAHLGTIRADIDRWSALYGPLPRITAEALPSAAIYA